MIVDSFNMTDLTNKIEINDLTNEIRHLAAKMKGLLRPILRHFAKYIFLTEFIKLVLNWIVDYFICLLDYHYNFRH